ncbi:MAG: NAD(P)H-dependent glycerol-3-phosphate dehydrogenase [Gammaproteobacteria bacterium]
MHTAPELSITVLGGGSWGTALAIELARNHNQVALWDHNPTHLDEIASSGTNQRYLPDIPLPSGIVFESDLAKAVANSTFILIAIPSHGFRTILQALQQISLKSGQPLRLAWATKGLEPESGTFLDQIAEEVVGKNTPFAVISGPTFALEVARGLPTAVTIASMNKALAADIVTAMHNSSFRTYTSKDIVGVEVGGAVKNVLAIAAGISDGLGFGANARAALITRGLAEMMRLAIKLGGQQETLMGLTGIGDLVLTCTDNQSRNRRLGLALGKGLDFNSACEEIGQAIEGAHTSRELALLANRLNIEMPITEQVYQVIYHQRPPAEAVKSLLAREQKAEII